MLKRTILILLLCTLGCESTPKNKPDVGNAASEKVTSIDIDGLLKDVVLLRDRGFAKSPPDLVPVAEIARTEQAGTPEYVADRQAISEVLFGTNATPAIPGIGENEIARYDAQKHAIEYVETADSASLERALVYATVGAIDSGHFAPPSPAKSWDAELANVTAQHALGSLVYAGLLAERRNVDLEVVALRPEAMAAVEPVAKSFELIPTVGRSLDDTEAAFIRREGFTLAAALMRSGGWSSAELVRIDPPGSAAYIVRPDKWLAGEDLGTWDWPENLAKARVAQGWTQTNSGRIGSAIAAMWLGTHIDPRIARSLYVSWQSDTYRKYTKGDQWAFEWISLWKSPADAEQVVQAFDAAFKEAKTGDFVVMKNGATVVVIGARSQKDTSKLTERATELLKIGPKFTPAEPQMVAFVPTPFDEYVAGVQEAQLLFGEQGRRWADPAANLDMSLEPLKDWKVQKTESATARWVAKHPAGDTILMNTELSDPFATKFDTDAYRAEVVSNFKKTMKDPNVVINETAKNPRLGPVHHLKITGQVNNLPSIIELWMFESNRTVVTLSLKAWPDTVEASRPTVLALYEDIQVRKAIDEKPADKGIIKFQVDE